MNEERLAAALRAAADVLDGSSLAEEAERILSGNVIPQVPIPVAPDQRFVNGITSAMDAVQEFHDKLQISQTQRLEDLEPSASRGLYGLIQVLTQSARELEEQIPAYNDDRRMVRVHLMCEELAELLDAMYCCNEVKTLDALADLLYVVLGTAVTLDLPLDEAFWEVHASNMTKEKQPTDPLAERVRDKGPNFRPPYLVRVLAEYRRRQMSPHSYDEKRGECLHCGKSRKEIFEEVDRGRVVCRGGKIS